MYFHLNNHALKFMHFRQKISFKSALEIFTSVSGHLITALTVNMTDFEGDWGN